MERPRRGPARRSAPVVPLLKRRLSGQELEMAISSTYSGDQSRKGSFVNMSRTPPWHPHRPHNALPVLSPPVDLETKPVLKRCVTPNVPGCRTPPVVGAAGRRNRSRALISWIASTDNSFIARSLLPSRNKCRETRLSGSSVLQRPKPAVQPPVAFTTDSIHGARSRRSMVAAAG